MKLIKPHFEILEQQSGIDGIYKMIELAGRTCYRSEDKITEDSAKSFVDRMIKSGHGAMLEHGTVYLRIPINEYEKNYKNKIIMIGIKVNTDNKYAYVTMNYRHIIENNWLDDLKYLCEPTEYHAKRVTVKFVCDRGVSHEFVRHRVFSFAQESTRYCNYSNKDKFGGEVTFIIPCWMDTIEEGAVYSYDTDIELWQKSEDANTSNFLQSIAWVEKNYLILLHNGWTPQQARAVLPNALKTELVMTGFISDWKHFFELRDSNKAHPQARELASPLHKEFIEKGLIK